MISGYGTASTSGTIIIRTLNAGAKGVSGELMFSTGTTSCGASGDVSIGTGTASLGDGGDISVVVGDGDTLDGGMIYMYAGKSNAAVNTGATGGSISMISGFGTKSTSGTIIIRTLNAGIAGVSGELMLSTGTTSTGASGDISIGTGTASTGDGGDISIVVGDGNVLDGGHIYLYAGKSNAAASTGATGGSISIISGFGTESTSGTIIIRTLNAGVKGVSGELMFSSGTTTCGASGDISI